MKNLSIITLIFIAWSPAHTMDTLDSDSESNVLFSNDNSINLLSDNKSLDHILLIEWAENVKKQKAADKVEAHLINLFWQVTTISSCIKNNKIDNAYNNLKPLNSLYKKATKNKNSILNDTWTQCLKPQENHFLEEFMKDEYTIITETNMTGLFTFNHENPKDLFEKACKEDCQKIIYDYQNMVQKIVLAGAALNNCEPDTWKQSVQTKEQATQKKEFKSIKKKKSCIIN